MAIWEKVKWESRVHREHTGLCPIHFKSGKNSKANNELKHHWDCHMRIRKIRQHILCIYSNDTHSSNESIHIPYKSGEDRRSWARGSIASANNNGESGQPCLMPWWIAKGLEMVPLFLNLAKGWSYSICK